VTAVTPGSAVVTATVDGVSAAYTLTVSNATITTMTVTPATLSIPKGLTTQFATTGTFSDATTQDLTFDAVWSSTPGTFATVSNNPVNKGLATATAIGNESIIATFGAVPVSGTATLTVTAATMQSITVTPANSIKIGTATVNFTATGNYSDGTAVDITSSVVWASSLTDVATIEATSGVATTKGAGTTTISATLNGIRGITTLTQSLKALSITPATPSVMSAGSTQQLTATATFNNSSTENVSIGCAWTSSSTSTATVDTKGLVTGVAAGTATITATYNGLSAPSVSVTVR